MQIITSISPTRLERQIYCINTWKELGLPIVAIQLTTDHPDLTKDLPIEVKYVEPPESTIFSKITPTFNSLFHHVDRPSLYINSDISIKEVPYQFWHKWEPKEKIIKVGVRKDYKSSAPHRKFTQKYGLDLILLLPEMELPTLPYQLGCPGWDFFIPWYLWHHYDYEIETLHGLYFHENHQIQWSPEDQQSYRATLKEHKLTGHMLAHFILDMTQRIHLKVYK